MPLKNTHVKFSRYRIFLEDEQINRIWYDPLLVQPVTHKSEYTFDKKLNKEDKKQFTIILTQRLNLLDNGIHHLDINLWNKIKANIIHKRYWVDREKEWFIKTLIAAAIGFVFGIIGSWIGYRQGYQNGLKEGKHQTQDTIRK